MALTSIRTRVDQISKVPTDVVSQTADGDRDQCIAGALLRYNRDRPRRITLVVAASGGSTWEYSLSANVSGWNPSQYSVVRVVYPGGQQSENVIDDNDWIVHRKADGTYWLRFIRNNPAAGSNIWIYYTAPHTLTSGTDTVSSDYPNDVEAFCTLAASLVMAEAANNYTAMSLSSLSLDNVDYKGLSDYCARRAKDLDAKYVATLGADRGAQSAFVDWDAQAQDSRDFLFWQGADA